LGGYDALAAVTDDFLGRLATDPQLKRFFVGHSSDSLKRIRLPYTLRWESRAIEAERPYRLQIRATGDFDGRGIWALKQNGRFVDVEFDWKLTAVNPLIRYLSCLLKPLFSANHRWAMARGQEGLARELEKRH
jgi:hypothetical protein